MFKYSDTNKRYHTFNFHLKQTFGQKVCKLSFNAGFSCPNIDGTKSFDGCIYCSKTGSGEFAGNINDCLKKQYEYGKALIQNKWSNTAYLAYFQARTNTYAPLSKLKAVYEEALTFSGIKGIAIATRADCITEEIADYLFLLSQKTYLIVELGLQTVNDKTAEYINRCHSYDDFLDGFLLLKNRNINVCVHLINGLPFETKEDMLLSAKTVGKLGVHSIKLHMLQILADTKLADIYKNSEFQLLSKEEYIDIITEQLALLPPEVVIQRLTGDGEHKALIAPFWCNDKKSVLNGIDKMMLQKNIFQGSKI